jgi:hypothetical protein
LEGILLEREKRYEGFGFCLKLKMLLFALIAAKSIKIKVTGRYLEIGENGELLISEMFQWLFGKRHANQSDVSR